MVLSMGKFGHLHSQKDIVWMLDVDKILFPECVARVPVSLWGFGGLRVCSPDVAQLSATVRNRPQPSATVRVRSLYGASGKCYKSGHFRRFQMSRNLVLCGSHGTS